MSGAAEGDALRGKLVRGALRQLSASLPAKVLGIVLTLLAARLLTPELYGEYSLAITIYGISDLITNPSVFTYFVRTPDAPDIALDSSWSVGVVRGALLTGLFWALSPLISSFFEGGEQVEALLQLLSCVFFVAGLRNPYVVKIYHRMDYDRIAVVDALGTFLGNLSGVLLLWWTEGPAALAAGSLVGQVVSCVVTWRYAERRPRFRVEWGELRVIWEFVRFLMINNVVIYLLHKFDDLFLGKVAGLELMGLYSLAYKIANDSVLYLITTLRQVLLPAFVKLFADREAFGRAGLNAVGALSSLSWMVSAVMVVGAEQVVLAVAPDEKWQGTHLVLQALMSFVLIRAVNGVYGSMVMAGGEPQVLTRVSGVQLLALLPMMALGYGVGERIDGPFGGVLGVTLAIALLNYGANVAMMWSVWQLFGVSMWEGMKRMWRLGPVTAICVWGGFWAQQWVEEPWAKFLLGAVVVISGVGLFWEGDSRWIARAPERGPWEVIRRLRRRERDL